MMRGRAYPCIKLELTYVGVVVYRTNLGCGKLKGNGRMESKDDEGDSGNLQTIKRRDENKGEDDSMSQYDKTEKDLRTHNSSST